MSREIEDWGIGEVCWHTFHGRCIVKEIQTNRPIGEKPRLTKLSEWVDPKISVIRESDGMAFLVYSERAHELIPIDEWDASKELKRLAEEI